MAPPDSFGNEVKHSALKPWLGVIALIVAMTVMRAVYASLIDLRTDEAYYWTWSKENVLSFLDHPPMVAWFVRFGTAIFGDTNFGARFAGLVAMFAAQVLLADIVWRVTRDLRVAVIAVAMMEASLYYGLLMTKIAPDVPLVLFVTAMAWALVRLAESGDGRWWLAAGLFAGMAALSKFTVALLIPAVLAFMWVPNWRGRWLRSPYPWTAAALALLLFTPVLIWNMQHDWASFRFQAVRAIASHQWSLRTFGEFLGLQFGLVGFVLLPVVLTGVVLTAWRGFRRGEAVAILLSTAVIVPFVYFLWKSLSLRVGDTWPTLIWPLGFRGRRHQSVDAAKGRMVCLLYRDVASLGQDRDRLRHRLCRRRLLLLSGDAVQFHRPHRSGRRRSRLRGDREADRGRAAKDRCDLDRHDGLPHLCDAALVFQQPRSGGANQRARALSGISRARHEPDRGPCRHLCRSRTRQQSVGGRCGLQVSAKREPLERVDRVWRGIVMDSYSIEKFTGWTPQLSPPPDSPLFDWRWLADAEEALRLRVAVTSASFRGARSASYDVQLHIVESLRFRVWSFGPSRNDDIQNLEITLPRACARGPSPDRSARDAAALQRATAG